MKKEVHGIAVLEFCGGIKQKSEKTYGKKPSTKLFHI